MKYILSLILLASFNVFANSKPYQYRDIDFKNLAKTMSEVKTLGQLSKMTRKNLYPEDQKFLEAKDKENNQSTPIKILRSGEREFSVQTGSSKALLQFPKPQDPTDFIFSLNRHEINFSPELKVSELFEKVTHALPKTHAAQPFFLSNAYAEEGIGELLVEATVDYALEARTEKNCEQIKEFSEMYCNDNPCEAAKAKRKGPVNIGTDDSDQPAQCDPFSRIDPLVKAAEFDNKWKLCIKSCVKESKELKGCLQTEFKKQYTKNPLIIEQIPDDLKNYFALNSKTPATGNSGKPGEQ